MNPKAIHYQRKLNGWYLVMLGTRNMGFTKKYEGGWIATARSGERLEPIFPKRAAAAAALIRAYQEHHADA